MKKGIQIVIFGMLFLIICMVDGYDARGEENVVLNRYMITRDNYTITYDANGGINAPAKQVEETTGGKRISYQQPTRAGYTFLGWTTIKDSVLGGFYQPGNIIYIDDDSTLYALWEKIETTQTTTYNLAKPTGVKYTMTKAGKVKLSWKKVNKAQKYNVYSAKKKNGKYTYVGNTTKCNYTVSGLKYGVTYYYKIRPVRNSGSYTYKEVKIKVKLSGKPSKPTANIQWNGSYFILTIQTKQDAMYYEMKLNNQKISGVNGKKLKCNNKKTCTLKFAGGVKKGDKNQIMVRLYNIVNGKKIYSAWSKKVEFTI